ncbi:DNA-processing protein DprA [Aliikangiella coralliicola]|uniref:DNA-protecting protein DprA n=1 Tax=Aliikangiella coralliicola TaxID=2592383 RepID=A0A545UGQ7_9GAMM|nr:DNA-processing protein DprA [Aliikangiella coralliicola]TQV88625.1 DNA-protecting protein DprA [Aliikangiella coralliicola]
MHSVKSSEQLTQKSIKNQKTQKSSNEIGYLLALKNLKGVGIISAHKLLNHFHTAQAIFDASKEQLIQAGLKSSVVNQILSFNFDALETALSWSDSSDRHIIPLNSAYYPPLLAETATPPLLLFALGNPELLLSPQIGVVGSRQPTAQGLSNTQSFCKALCEHGLTITSGLATGIDGEAHRAALAADGHTIAVMGTGLNRVYPAHHRELAHQIAERGLLISEKMPMEPFDRGSFPQRNRIIAGLSLGTLVVEAAEKSGTLITARCSVDEGRDVFAIPGSIHNSLAKGCHKLIKQGAKLVESVEDIIEDLPCIAKGQIDRSQQHSRAALSQEDAEFLKLIDYDITSLDTIVVRSQLTVEAVTNKLLLLELEGWIINSAGGYIRQ